MEENKRGRKWVMALFLFLTRRHKLDVELSEMNSFYSFFKSWQICTVFCACFLPFNYFPLCVNLTSSFFAFSVSLRFFSLQVFQLQLSHWDIWKSWAASSTANNKFSPYYEYNFLLAQLYRQTALVFHNIHVKPVCGRKDLPWASNSARLMFWQQWELHKSL